MWGNSGILNGMHYCMGSWAWDGAGRRRVGGMLVVPVEGTGDNQCAFTEGPPPSCINPDVCQHPLNTPSTGCHFDTGICIDGGTEDSREDGPIRQVLQGVGHAGVVTRSLEDGMSLNTEYSKAISGLWFGAETGSTGPSPKATFTYWSCQSCLLA